MAWRPLVQPDLQELPQTQGVCHSPRDSPFTLDPLEETDQHRPEIHPRCERRAAQLLVIELAAARFTELVELCLLQHFVQSSIKRMPRSFRQIAAIPKLLLSLTPRACSHRHGKTLP